MKTVIATLCTLALSFIGAFGVNQNSTDITQNTTTNADTVKVQEYSTTVDQIQNITADASTDTILNTQQDANKVEDTRAKIRANALGDLTTGEVQTPEKDQQTFVKGASTTVPSKVSAKTSCPKNQKTVLYKNVDISKCKSTADIKNKLKQNGYTLKSSDLKKLLTKVQKNCSAKNNATTKPSTGSNSTNTETKPVTKPVTNNNSGSTSNTNQNDFASQVIKLVNQERAKAGLSAFTTNAPLTAAANKRAQEIVQSFSHTRPDGSSSFTALKDYKVSYNTAGENIAYGQKTPQEVVTGWMNSPGHRANILNKNFNKIGVGVYQVNGTYYWTQEFTN